MNMWKSIRSAALALTLLLPVVPAAASGGTQTPGETYMSESVRYELPNGLKTELKGISNEKTGAGYRIGAAIRMVNESDVVRRIPDFELRAITASGVAYTLQASTANAGGVLPIASEELTYLLTIPRKDAPVWTGLRLVHVNWDVYPKRETVLLDIPLGAGAQTSHTVLPWGASFALSQTESKLVYKTVSFTRETAGQRNVRLLKLEVENRGTIWEAIPSILVEGITAEQLKYRGSRAEQGELLLGPGQKRYIHYPIDIGNGAEPRELSVLLPESFYAPGAAPNAAPDTFAIEALRIDLAQLTGSAAASPEYALSAKLAFDPLNDLIDPDIDVSIEQFQMHKNEDEGYQTAILKFKLHNTSDSSLPLPTFQAELVDPAGKRYAGMRQAASAQQLMPGLAYAVSYAFALPSEETGDKLKVNLYDGTTTPAVRTLIASNTLSVQPLETGNKLNFYPFTVEIGYHSLSALYSEMAGYTYRLKLDLTLKRAAQVVVDRNFSQMHIEFVDGIDRVLGSRTLPFIGVNRIIDGAQVIDFPLQTTQHDTNARIHIYELIETANGPAKRLVKVLK